MSGSDATRKRLTHTAFMSSDELLALLEENVRDYAIIVTNTERRIINWSRGAEAILGHSVDEVLGKDTDFIYTQEDRDGGRAEREFRAATETGRAVDECYHVRKDGSLLWGSGILTALFEDDRTLRGFVKILRDITDRKQLEEDLRQETATAQRERERAEASALEVMQLNELLRRSMMEAHHRIKNSFQMLSALLDMQITNRADSPSLENCRQLAVHIQSLAAIHDLLTEEVKTSAEFDFINARSLLERLVQLIGRTLTGRTIHTDIEDVALPIDQATALCPLISEIVINAVKHASGDITLRFAVEHGTGSLQISDQGPGFPAGFSPVNSAHTGIELIETIARHDLRGETHYDNIPGGARVTVRFPTHSLPSNDHEATTSDV